MSIRDFFVVMNQTAILTSDSNRQKMQISRLKPVKYINQMAIRTKRNVVVTNRPLTNFGSGLMNL